ncbi:MAG: porin [Candidatus Thiodiazotropha sp. (ex Ctena orbiculata)]|uniref:Porin n=1 Tax=Candidatus Thiodiazotropha taylori TaxID=2792791 RepID=A0A944MC06_9GAMM|nr:porin [Candidatus Thiodiazotropha taylori]MBT3025613.1 porin [Candidatus Thiodiazotropha taylori]MBT3033914.1 porin [Candidatus Thiodiazotropha taylori]MBV2135417.1 porin [Candidatus Thiodiazotropha taylori]PUB85934.1 MAG: porin [gamma proteobacterium symbiont of Ctena orbiculata]
MKKVLSLAIAAALVAPAAVMADATLFGKAHFIIENVDDGDTDVWGVDSIHSRVGVKGSEDLGGGLKAVYHFEFKVNQDSGSGLGDRNQFMGLAGGFGTALLGRHDTPLKMAQGKFDEFGDLPNGDLANVIPGDDRVDNVIAYVSPAMGGLTFVGALVSGERPDLELDGPADHISLAGLYSNGPIFASLAYNSYDLGQPVDAEPSLLRLTGIWNAGMWQVGVMWASMDLDLDGVDDPDYLGLSGHVKVGSGKIKAQYLMGDSTNGGVSGLVPGFTPNVNVGFPVSDPENEVTQFSVGYEHSMSKRTKAHVGFTSYEEDETDVESDAFFAGLIHSF